LTITYLGCYKNQMKKPRSLSPYLIFIAALGAGSSALGQIGAGWPSYGQNLNNNRFAASETILNPSNVGNLAVKWIFTTSDDVAATPSVDPLAKWLYVPDWAGNLYKIHTDTGNAVWTHAMTDYGLAPGTISRTTPVISGTTLIVAASPYLGEQAPLGAYLLAINTVTGKLMWKVQPDPNQNALLTGSPIVYNGVVYLGVSSAEEYQTVPTFRGSVQAYSLATGALLWQTYTVPPGYTGGPVWSGTPAIDTKRGSLYVTTGNNYTVPLSVQNCEQLATTSSQILACQDPANYFDSMIALDLNTGAIKWGRRMISDDAFIGACIIAMPGCPQPSGPDFDFGAGANLFTTIIGGQLTDIVGVGQKSGAYWALNPDNGNVVWVRQVGPGGILGGIQWGTATDSRQIYVAVANSSHTPYSLKPSGMPWIGASWAALGASAGNINWQVPDPGTSTIYAGLPALATAPVTVANGVVYVASMSGCVYALNASSGAILWSYNTGASVNGGAAVVNGSVYWGSGYGHFPKSPPQGTSNNKLFAFWLPPGHY
jgi:polyvinyl alcohol dehydrogenase (cytochrome)